MDGYYIGVDEMPLYNWIKANEGNLTYCRKDSKQGNQENDFLSFDIIKDDNYKVFGISKDYLRLLQLELELSEINLELVITGDNFLKNKILRLKAEIEEITSREDDGSDVDETLIVLTKWMGSRVDPRVVTVKEFRSMITLFKKENTKIKK